MAVATALVLAQPSVFARGFLGDSQDSVFVVRALASAQGGASIGNVTLHFARQLLGRPYVAHTLEVGDDHTIVVNTRQLDCTTLVENVVALSQCHNAGDTTFEGFLKRLERLRYRGGRMDGYTSRLHYFTDWICDNGAKGLVSEVQSSNSPFTAVQTINVGYMSSHPKTYKALREHPEYVGAIKKMEQSLKGKKFRYIPKTGVTNTKLMRSAVHDGDIIAIVGGKQGIDIAHLGFAVWRIDGLHLLNASMLHGKVVEEPMALRQYLGKHKTHKGIRIVRLNAAND